MKIMRSLFFIRLYLFHAASLRDILCQQHSVKSFGSVRAFRPRDDFVDFGHAIII